MSAFLDKANQYIDSVLNGEIIACDEVKKACRRQKNDLWRQNTDAFPYVFDEEKAEKPCRFISMFCHVKGEWKGQKIKLEPWQCFVLTTLYGWVSRDDSRERRYQAAYVEVPRKNGKSLLAAAVCLYALMADGEKSPEVYCGATNLQQSFEVFRPATEMINGNPEIKKYFGVECYAKSIICKFNGGRFECVIGQPKDGKSPSLACCDELHEFKTSDLVDSFVTGFGSRKSPMLFCITTAGTDLTSPCKDKHDFIRQILSGAIENDREFGVIYTIPQGMDWQNFDSWRYANPCYNVSISEKFLKAQYETATQRVSQQNSILTKNLNVWCSVNESWMNMTKLCECADPKLTPDDLKGKKCIVGLDLAEKLDLTCAVLCFYDETDVWVFPKFYLPQGAVDRATTDVYKNCIAKGLLTVCEGEVMDLMLVKQDLDEWREKYEANRICYDPWHAAWFIQMLNDEYYECVEVRPNVAIMSEAMKQNESDIYSGKFHFDGNQMLIWNYSNVVAHYDAKQNIYPRKEKNCNKIDCVMSILTAYDSIMRFRVADSIEPGVFFI